MTVCFRQVEAVKLIHDLKPEMLEATDMYGATVAHRAADGAVPEQHCAPGLYCFNLTVTVPHHLLDVHTHVSTCTIHR